VIADIPGLIRGAAEGAGLGTRFLRHVSRTRLLLHLVDAAGGGVEELADDIRAIEQELAAFDATLLARERWLVLNKIDLLTVEGLDALSAALRERLHWQAPLYRVSAITGAGCRELMQDIHTWLANQGRNAGGQAVNG